MNSKAPLVPASERTFRLFVSSTFGDFAPEREALQRRVFPALRSFCAARGCRLEVIDLRWGVSAQAARDHDTMDVCLDEMARARAGGLTPYVLAMLGDRYGWRPPPPRIPATVFEAICKNSSAAILKRSYRLDRNAVPESFVLRPASKGWAKAEAALRDAFDEAAAAGVIPVRDRWRYIASATEQELVVGAFTGRATPGSVVAVFKTIDGEDDGADKESAQVTRHRRLLSRIRKTCGKHAIELHTRRSSDGADPAYIEEFVTQVESKLRHLMKRQIEALGPFSPIDQERQSHRAFSLERGALLLGRDDVMRKLAAGLRARPARPLILMGPAGSGKSSVMARLSTRLQDKDACETLVRFCGLTPASSTVPGLLESLCREIFDRFRFEAAKRKRLAAIRGNGHDAIQQRRKVEADFAVPAEPAELARVLREFCARIPRNRPSVLIIDAIDQLTGAEASSLSAWLPLELPEHVRLVLSIATDAVALRDGHVQRVGERIDLPPMPGDAMAGTLDTRLRAGSRTLQPAQRAAVLKAANASGTPLHLTLLAEKAKGWPSWYTVGHLPVDTEPAIRAVLDDLNDDARHGRTLVARTLALIAAGRRGLTEDELADVLSADQEVMAEFRRRSPESPPVGALPPIVLSRLIADLRPYLTTGQSEGARVMRFFHRQFTQMIARDLLNGPARIPRHLALARYFTRPVEVSDGEGNTMPDRRAIAELPFHLARANRLATLQSTLFDASFLTNKMRADGPVSALEDFELVANGRMPDPLALSELAAGIRLSIVPLSRRPEEITSQLPGRLMDSRNDVVSRLVADLQQRHTRPALHPLRASWWSATGTLLRTIATGAPVVTGAVRGDRILLATESGIVQVWNAVTGLEHMRLRHPGEEVTAATFSSDGSMALTAGTDNALRIWDLVTGTQRAFFDTTDEGRIDWLQLSPDEKRVLSVSYRTVTERTLANPGSREPSVLPEYAHRIDAAIEMKDARVVAGAYDGSVVVYERHRRDWTVHPIKAHKGQVTRLASLADGTLVSAGRDGAIRIWDSGIRNPRLKLQGESDTYPMALLASGDDLILGSTTGRVDAWNRTAAKMTFSFQAHEHWITGIGRSADDRNLVTMSADGTARVWDSVRLASADKTQSIECHEKTVTKIVVTRDGRLAVSASADRTLIVWSTESGRAIKRLKGHEGWIQDLALFSDGKRAVSTSSDGTLRVWDIDRGVQLHCLDHHKDPLHGVAITPDERTVLTAFHVEDGQDHVYGVHLWDAVTWKWRGLQVDEPENKKASFANASALAISNDGALALAPEPYNSGWSVWRLSDQKMLHQRIAGAAGVVSAIPVGQTEVLVALENGAVERRDLARGHMTTLVANTGGNGRAIGMSSDGRLIVTSAEDNGVAVWDATSGTLVVRATTDAVVTACTITPDASGVLTGDESGRFYTMRLAR